MRRLIFAVLFAVFVGCSGVVLSLALGEPPQGLSAGGDKLHHFTAFIVLTASAATAFRRLPILLVALALAAAGGAIELLQGIPAIGREASWLDFGADGLGVGIGTVLGLGLRRELDRALDQFDPQATD